LVQDDAQAFTRFDRAQDAKIVGNKAPYCFGMCSGFGACLGSVDEDLERLTTSIFIDGDKSFAQGRLD
jgi:hypothetical protein